MCDNCIPEEILGLLQNLSHGIPQMPCDLDTVPILQMEKADLLYQCPSAAVTSYNNLAAYHNACLFSDSSPAGLKAAEL